MLLLVDKQNNIPNSINQFWKFYFSELIEIKDLRKSKALIKDKKTEAKIQEIKNIQKKIFSTQSQVQRDNLDYIKKSEFKQKELKDLPFLKDKAKYFDKLNQKEVIVRAKIFEFQIWNKKILQ
jgi:hypothetical protein